MSETLLVKDFVSQKSNNFNVDNFRNQRHLGIQDLIPEELKMREDGRPYYGVKVNDDRDALITPFGKATLDNRYLLKNESYQDLFARAASDNATDEAHAQRMYEYISKHWIMPATPVLSNSGTRRGLPISCFLNEAEDSLEGIIATWTENVWLGAKGGGSGTYWGNIRSINEAVGETGLSSGVVPFLYVQNAISLGISQGGVRRASSAFYMPIWHPEIEEFTEIRKPTGGDPARRCLNSHHGIVIDDAFMEAVVSGSDYPLRSPKTHKILRRIDARLLWIKILTMRLEQGEPYLLFIDTVRRAMPQFQKDLGLTVKMSNLCSEITLPTGVDHLGMNRTAVCCLSSLNMNYWDEFKDDDQFFEDVFMFLDNVLQNFIDRAPPELHRAIYSAIRERSVGLGVMGWHDFLQNRRIPFESMKAVAWNKKTFSVIRKQADRVSRILAERLGPCPDAAERGVMERFACKLSIAPTASISIIAGNASPGIETINTNAYLQKTLSGSYLVKNKALEKLLIELNQNTNKVWNSIKSKLGSVQHLDFLDQEQKDIFKTAFEIDQVWVIRQASARAPYICQAQSLNIFLPPNCDKQKLHNIHIQAWRADLKSLYYCRSLSIHRAENVSNSIVVKPITLNENEDEGNDDNIDITGEIDQSGYETCLSCQ